MTVAARLPRRKKARHAGARRSARLVRPARPCLAVARAARRAARTLIASGCPRSCCSRPRSRQSRRTTPGFCRAGRRSTHSRRPASTMCCAFGPGLAITRARAICTLARKQLSSGMAGSFRMMWMRCARCPASATTPPRRWRRSLSICRRCRSTAMSSAWCRGCSPSKTNCRRQSPRSRQLAASLLPARRAGDFAQALMDLGATICSPKRPACALCPWNDSCLASERGDQETFPRKAPKREGRLRRGAAFVVLRADGRVLAAPASGQGLACCNDGSARQRLDA